MQPFFFVVFQFAAADFFWGRVGLYLVAMYATSEITAYLTAAPLQRRIIASTSNTPAIMKSWSISRGDGHCYCCDQNSEKSGVIDKSHENGQGDEADEVADEKVYYNVSINVFQAQFVDH